MKKINVRVVDSISAEKDRIQSRIRDRAYGIFLGRTEQSNGELEDWLAAEREVISALTPTVKEDEREIVAQVAIPEINPKDLHILATTREVLIHTGTEQERQPFGVIQFPLEVNPARIRAEAGSGILQITVRISETGRSLQRSA